MFDVNTNDVRNFFADTWKNRLSNNLSLLQKKVLNIILAYPQYIKYLENVEDYLDYNWTPEKGETNPFLVLSLHLSIQEQVDINQPIGIKDIHTKLCAKYNNWKDAESKMMDALVEMIWKAEVNKTSFNEKEYLENLRKLI